MAKNRDGLIKYEKRDNPDQFTWFSAESIARYDPAKRGWVPSVGQEQATPVDVVNFMEGKKCDPIKVDIEKVGQVAPPEPEITEYITTPISRLEDALKEANEESLLHIIKTDERKTAVKMAEKELKSREQ